MRRNAVGIIKDHLFLLVVVLLCALPIALAYLPSMDKLEEAHGFLVSDGYVKGNGVLVGINCNGKDRVAFLTCKHVITEKMLTHHHSFVSNPDSREKVFINLKGRGFAYGQISGVQPLRWRFSRDASLDFSWFVLTDEERNNLVGSGTPVYVNLDKGKHEVLQELSFAKCGVNPGCALRALSIWSPVYGDPMQPSKMLYANYYWINRLTGNAYALVTDVDLRFAADRPPSKMVSIDADGFHEMSVLQWGLVGAVHANNSGAPIFAKNAESRWGWSLVGMVTSGFGDSFGGFQTLDRLLPELIESLEQGWK